MGNQRCLKNCVSRGYQELEKLQSAECKRAAASARTRQGLPFDDLCCPETGFHRMYNQSPHCLEPFQAHLAKLYLVPAYCEHCLCTIRALPPVIVTVVWMTIVALFFLSPEHHCPIRCVARLRPPNDLFTGLAGWQDSTVLKTTLFAPNRHFRGESSQVRCNLGCAAFGNFVTHWLSPSKIRPLFLCMPRA